MHFLDHERGTIDDLKEGSNWFNMLYGVFYEPREQLINTGGHTDVCFHQDGPNLMIQLYSNDYSSVQFASSGSDVFDTPLPPGKVKVLANGDRFKVLFPNDVLIIDNIVLAYRKTEN